MRDIKNKASKGLVWAGLENASIQGIRFVIGIILARLLNPSDYGLLGLLTVFLVISEVLINSGFGSALIQNKDRKEKDFNTVFVFNIVSAIFFWLLLSLLSNKISLFFREDKLIQIIPIFTFTLVLNAVISTQNTKLVCDLNFKATAIASLISVVFGGIVGVVCAYRGFGVWSLVFQTLSIKSISIIILIIQTKWIPRLQFSKQSFIGMYKFGINIVLIQLVNKAYEQIYSVIIGKFYGMKDLGYYSRGKHFTNLLTGNIHSILWKVMYPTLSLAQENITYYKRVFSRFLSINLLIVCPAMVGLYVLADSFIVIVLGEKWSGTIEYLKLLSIVGFMYPLLIFYPKGLEAIGKVKEELYLDIIKKIILLAAILLSVSKGITYMLVYQIYATLVCVIINIIVIKHIIGFGFIELLNTIKIPYTISFTIGSYVLLLGRIIPNVYTKLIVSVFTSIILYIILLKIFKVREIDDLRKMLIKR